MILFPREKFKYAFLHLIPSLFSPFPSPPTHSDLSKSTGNGLAQPTHWKRAGRWSARWETAGRISSLPHGAGKLREDSSFLSTKCPFPWPACLRETHFQLSRVVKGHPLSFLCHEEKLVRASLRADPWLFIIWGEFSSFALAQRFIKQRRSW